MADDKPGETTIQKRLVYVCEGGDCTEKGSGDLCDKLKEMLEETDPHEAKNKVRRYPCFGGCEVGINISLFPDRVFYSHVTEKDLPDIVQHLEHGGEPVKRLTGFAKPDVEEMIWGMLDTGY